MTCLVVYVEGRVIIVLENKPCVTSLQFTPQRDGEQTRLGPLSLPDEPLLFRELRGHCFMEGDMGTLSVPAGPNDNHESATQVILLL